VLELGAGHGLPGIIAGLQHSARVDFHDRAANVLRSITAVNAAANGLALAADESSQGARFLAGDWRQVCEMAKAKSLQYDVVLAAEAIYRSDMYADLTALLKQCLAPEGVAWFAGKRFYFGCGGGTASFAAHLRENGFLVKVNSLIEDLRSNTREVLLIERAAIADDVESPMTERKRRRLNSSDSQSKDCGNGGGPADAGSG